MQKAIITFLGIILTIAIVYGFYWVIKTTSYKIFYESMVRSSIVEMVKPEALRRAVK